MVQMRLSPNGVTYRLGLQGRGTPRHNSDGRRLADRARWGSVINIASAAALIGRTPEVVYSTLKAAVDHHTRCLALEPKEHGVRVNAVSPGATETARFKATRTVDPTRMEIGKSLSRYAEPAEIADAVAFLAGHGSRFVNGQVLRVDGGFTIFAG